MKKALFILAFGFYVNVNAQVPSYVPTNGLIGYWPFTGNANDLSGNGNNGVVSGATLTSDRFGNANAAYNYTGNDNIIANFPSALTGDWTISAWYYKTGTSNFGTEYFLSFGSLREGDGIGFGGGLNSCGNNIFALYDGNGTSGCFIGDIINGSALNYGHWTNLVTVKSGNTYSLYSNGTLSASGALASAITISNLYIGMRADYQFYFNGYIDDIGSWNRALTSTEVTNIYNGTATGINELEKNKSTMSLYPNPSNGNFILEAIGKQTVQIFDLNGKMVLSQYIIGKTNINAENLSEGVYNFSLVGAEGVVNKKVVIIK